MKPLNYIKSLLPNFEKSQILEDCRVIKSEIQEFTVPAYASADKYLKGHKFKSKEIQDLFSIFNTVVKHGATPISTINDSWKDIIQNITNIENLVDRTFNNDLISTGFTYAKANVLQYIECLSYVVKYSRKLLLYVYTCETATYDDSGVSEVELAEVSLSKFEVSWLNTNMVTFAQAFNVVRMTPSKTTELFDDVPDITITELNSNTLPHTVGAAKLDPFSMNLIPVFLNPVYHVGLWIAEWQSSRYKVAREERELLDLRLLNLKNTIDGKKDAAVEKEIVVVEDRLKGLNYKIHKMEKSNGINS